MLRDECDDLVGLGLGVHQAVDHKKTRCSPRKFTAVALPVCTRCPTPFVAHRQSEESLGVTAARAPAATAANASVRCSTL